MGEEEGNGDVEGEGADDAGSGPEGEGEGLEGERVGPIGGEVGLTGGGDSPKSECWWDGRKEGLDGMKDGGSDEGDG